MGPRPFGRGRSSEVAYNAARALLQWGRDLSVAEGPQTSGGGNHPPCFNGAATFRSRKANVARTAATSRSSFNGAATFRSRKAPPSMSTAGQSACFNGAATFRSRKDEPEPEPKDWRTPASMGPRPFGRGRLCARHADSTICRLQWGRDLSVAEGAEVMPGRGVGLPLQWGRDLSVAEGRQRAHRAGALVSFNGAATFRSRKVAKPAGRPAWYQGFNGAATFRSRKDVADRRNANGAAWLQWGRDLSVAEGRGRPVPPSCGRMLQWGRDLSVAEGAASRCAAGAAARASMGPRPFGRGRLETAARFDPFITLQWGRDLSVAEGRRCGG